MPGAQPAQSVLAPSAIVSLEKAAHAEGRSGAAQVRVTQLSGAADAGCVPGEHTKAPLRHCARLEAPLVAVVVPAGQGVQDVMEADPTEGLKVLKGHSSAAPAPAAAYEPAGATAQAEEPAGAKVPAAQGAHCARALAPGVALAVPAGQGTQPENVCPGAGLYEPAAHWVQLERLVAAGRLEK